ncbi:MAG: hypothetical protein U0166_25890 [Acidobacteriota bacterium]
MRRSVHAMAYDRSRSVTVLFGGYNQASAPIKDTWEYDGAAWTAGSGTGSHGAARGFHVMAYDDARPQ